MLNHITIMGRLTDEPELRYTQGSKPVPVLAFTVACDRDIAAADGKRETDFVRCVAWRRTAEFIAKYFSKGDLAALAGRLEVKKWKDKDNRIRDDVHILVSDAYFAQSRKSRTYTAAPDDDYDTSDGASQYGELEGDDGELPF